MLLATAVRFNQSAYTISEGGLSEIVLVLDNPVSIIINVTITVNTINVTASGEYYSIQMSCF